jgi:hypothetical protein
MEYISVAISPNLGKVQLTDAKKGRDEYDYSRGKASSFC